MVVEVAAVNHANGLKHGATLTPKELGPCTGSKCIHTCRAVTGNLNEDQRSVCGRSEIDVRLLRCVSIGMMEANT
jgi:hypothetical protein